MTQTIFIEGHITPKGRPRFYVNNGQVRTYTPTETVSYENWVRTCWKEQGGKMYGDEAQLGVVITAAFPIPKSTPKYRKQMMLDDKIRPIRRPDADNIAKVVLDSLVGVAYRDDSQVVNLTVQKIYADKEVVCMTIWEV